MRSLQKKSLVAGIAAIALVALSGCEMDVKLKVIDENTIEPSVIVAMSEAEKDMLSSMSDGEEVTCDSLADLEDNTDVEGVKDLSSGGDLKCELVMPNGEGPDASRILKRQGEDLVLTLPKEDIDSLNSDLDDAGDLGELGIDSITMQLIIQMPNGIKTATVDGKPIDFHGDTVKLELTDINGEVKVVSSPGIPGGNGGDEAGSEQDPEYAPDVDLIDAGQSVATGITVFLVAIALFGILIIAGIVVLIVVLVKKGKAKTIPADQFGQPMMYGQPGQPMQPGIGQPGQPGQPVQPGQTQFGGQPGQPMQPVQPGVGQPQYGQPMQPAQPGQPQPGQPVQSNPFAQPSTSTQPAQPGQPQPQFDQQNQPGQAQFGQPQSFPPNISDQGNPFSAPTDSTQGSNPQN